MPELDRFYREAADKAALLAVAPASQESGMRGLIMEGGYQFPLMLDQGDVGDAYKVRYVPTLFVIDPAGKIHTRHTGVLDRPELDEILEAIRVEFSPSGAASD